MVGKEPSFIYWFVSLQTLSEIVEIDHDLKIHGSKKYIIPKGLLDQNFNKVQV